MTDWGPIGQQVFDRTYARTKEDGTKETFDEVVSRMVDGNLALVDPRFVQATEREDLIRLISQHKLVPAGRHWWVSGVPGRQFLFNCHRAGWTDQLADHVEFTFDELMKGGGVGANYSTEYVERMYRVRRKVNVSTIVGDDHPDRDEAVHLHYDEPHATRPVSLVELDVEDSREGWVNALGSLCRLAQIDGPELFITFYLDRVRARGTSIRGFGGTASGPGPLSKMLVNIAEIMNQHVGQKLTPIACMDIDHAIASCVVAGNVRRSARMSILRWDDASIWDFLALKASGGHWTTNISVELDSRFWKAYDADDLHARAVLRKIAEGMHHNGEPGIFNSHLAAHGENGDVRCTNPCGEIALEEWENCNLGHVNLAKVDDMDEAKDCAALMARWLIRATFSDGMSWRQREVVNRNRRIGVGILGFQEWLWREHKLEFNRLTVGNQSVAWDLKSLAYTTQLDADAYANELEISFPVKCTTVAPTGTTAKISGTTEGIHPIFARYFVRRVRYASNDPALVELRADGYEMEDDLVNPNTVVVSFPCRDAALDVIPEKHLVQSDECTPDQMLSVQRVVQQSWADNAVSFTVNFDPKRFSAKYIEGELTMHGRFLKGTTFMPEGSYEQAPLERIDATSDVHWLTASGASECEGACPIR